MVRWRYEWRRVGVRWRIVFRVGWRPTKTPDVWVYRSTLKWGGCIVKHLDGYWRTVPATKFKYRRRSLAMVVVEAMYQKKGRTR